MAVEVSPTAAAAAAESPPHGIFQQQGRSPKPRWLAEFARGEAAFARCAEIKARYVMVELRVIGQRTVHRFGLCLPRCCKSDAAEVLALHFVAKRQHASLSATVEAVNVSVHGVARWAELQLDWVIAGFMKCGSTTLAANLGFAGHPELATWAAEGFGNLDRCFAVAKP